MSSKKTQEIKTWVIIFFVVLGFFITLIASLSAISLTLGDIEDIESSAIIKSKQTRKERGSRYQFRKTKYYLDVDYIIEIDATLKYMDNETYNTETIRRGKNVDFQSLNHLKSEEFTEKEQFEIDLFSDSIKVSKGIYSKYKTGDEITVWYRANNPWTASYNLKTDKTSHLINILLGLLCLTASFFLAWKNIN